MKRYTKDARSVLNRRIHRNHHNGTALSNALNMLRLVRAQLKKAGLRGDALKNAVKKTMARAFEE